MCGAGVVCINSPLGSIGWRAKWGALSARGDKTIAVHIGQGRTKRGAVGTRGRLESESVLYTTVNTRLK